MLNLTLARGYIKKLLDNAKVVRFLNANFHDIFPEFEAIAAAEACAEAGVECFVGGFFETGLGRCVNAALAGRAEFSLPGDLGDPDRYLAANPFAYLPEESGTVRLSDAPGLGAELRPGVMAAHRTYTRRVDFGS